MFNPSHNPQLDSLSQLALDSVRDRICLLDGRGTILLTNSAWESFAQSNGAKPHSCGWGINYLEVCRAARGPFSEGASAAAAGIQKVLRGIATHFILDYPCPSNSRKAWFRLTARPLAHAEGGALISHSDVTDRVLLAEELRCAEARYSAIMENPADAATVVTPEGTVHYQSPGSERVFGHRADALLGRNFAELVHQEDSPLLAGILHDCAAGNGQKHRAELRIRDGNGSWRVVESVARKLATHPACRIVINSRDITDKKQAERALREKQNFLERQGEELGSLVARLLRQHEDERRRIAAELRESACSRLALLTLQAAQLAALPAPDANELQALRDGVGRLSELLRYLAQDLHPAMLDHLGLAVTLREYCQEFQAKRGVQVTYCHREVGARLPGPVASALYRVAEEALANVARHARTQRAWVSLSRTARGIRLVVRDRGCGFDPAGLADGSSLGILAMRERLRLVNGTLAVRSTPGQGTEIVSLVPPIGRP